MKYPLQEDGERHASLFVSNEMFSLFKVKLKEGFARHSVFMSYLISDDKLSKSNWNGESSTHINGLFCEEYFPEDLIIEAFEILKSNGYISSYSISKTGLISISFIDRERLVMTEPEYLEYNKKTEEV